MSSKFITRLLYYLSGFGIGIIMVMLLFQNRACTWVPKNRVKQDINSRVVVISDDFKQQISKRNITREMIRKVIAEGSVDFENSQKRQNPKVYNLHDDHLKLNFSLPEYSYISELTLGFHKPNNFKTSLHGKADLYLFPKDKNILYIDSAAKESVDYQKIGSPSSKMLLKALQQSGQIDFDRSNFAARPKAEQYLTCNYNRHLIGMKTVWLKEKIDIYEIEILP